MNIISVLIGLSLLGVSTVFSHEHPTPPEMPKEFELLKKMEGSWEGTAVMEGKEQKVSVVYKITSGGTALTEQLGPGTPHEMISVYHREGKSLGMTHYCALGNQPHMKLKKSDGHSVGFEMVGVSGISSIKEPHMHGVTLTLNGDDDLVQDWVHFENGKAKEHAVFKYKRKK